METGGRSVRAAVRGCDSPMQGSWSLTHRSGRSQDFRKRNWSFGVLVVSVGREGGWGGRGPGSPCSQGRGPGALGLWPAPSQPRRGTDPATDPTFPGACLGVPQHCALGAARLSRVGAPDTRLYPLSLDSCWDPGGKWIVPESGSRAPEWEVRVQNAGAGGSPGLVIPASVGR